MAAWMLYMTMFAGALGGAGVLAERGFRHLGRPVRWVWVSVMAGAVALPVGLAFAASTRAATSGAGVGAGARAAGIAGPGGVLGGPAVWSRIPTGLGSSTADVALLAAWLAVSLILFASLRLSAWTLRRNERAWRNGRVDGHRVLVSAGFGPGVIGALRPRTVLPGWVIDSDESLRRLILMHEVEHVRAGDTRLLLGGLILAMLVPWCIPVWWHLHRLRAAIETDCDARVLAAEAPARAYAEALVAVASGRSSGLLPVSALAPAHGELKRRIRFIAAAARARSSLAGVGFLTIAASVVLGVGTLPAPEPPSVSFEANHPAAGFPREATIVYSVAGEDSEGQASAR